LSCLFSELVGGGERERDGRVTCDGVRKFQLPASHVPPLKWMLPTASSGAQRRRVLEPISVEYGLQPPPGRRVPEDIGVLTSDLVHDEGTRERPGELAQLARLEVWPPHHHEVPDSECRLLAAAVVE